MLHRLRKFPVALLSSLKIGGTAVTFDDELTATFATTAASNKIAAVAAEEGDTLLIKNGSTVVENNDNATWSEGSNTLTVKVTDGLDSSITNTYTVTVTYTAPEP